MPAPRPTRSSRRSRGGRSGCRRPARATTWRWSRSRYRDRVTLEWRQRRIAQNETSFREINDRLEEGLRQAPHLPELQQFVCECGNRECNELVCLTFDEYDAVRS